jgi:hypothetical protein
MVNVPENQFPFTEVFSEDLGSKLSQTMLMIRNMRSLGTIGMADLP